MGLEDTGYVLYILNELFCKAIIRIYCKMHYLHIMVAIKLYVNASFWIISRAPVLNIISKLQLYSALCKEIPYMAKLSNGKTVMVRVQNCHLREHFSDSMLVDLLGQSTRP